MQVSGDRRDVISFKNIQPTNRGPNVVTVKWLPLLLRTACSQIQISAQHPITQIRILHTNTVTVPQNQHPHQFKTCRHIIQHEPGSFR
jgi:hypothetical protein